MMKHGDWVRIDYTGKLEDGTVFDTTLPDVAKREHLDTKETFAPVTICLGEGMLLAGLDKAIIGKSGTFSVTLQPEDAFGKKDPKLLQVVPTPQLAKQGIRPYPGLQLSIDGKYGIVRRTGGGRTTVDFNHPLASRPVVYDVTLHAPVTDLKEQVTALLTHTGLPFKAVTVQDKAVTILMDHLLPQPLLDALNERIRAITTAQRVSFEAGAKP